MKKTQDIEMKEEYDFKALGKGIRGKYFKRYREETNIVEIDSDLAEEFPNTKAVNDALRELLFNRSQAV